MGDVQVNCWERPPTVCRYPASSGDVVAVSPPRPSDPITAPSLDWVRQPLAPVNAAPLHGICSFHEKLNLFRGVACQVRRTLPSCQLSAPRASFVASGTYRYLPG